MWWPSVDLGPDGCQFLVLRLLLLLLLSPWRRMTDSRRLPAPGLMFIHLPSIVFRPHANVQMEALLAPTATSLLPSPPPPPPLPHYLTLHSLTLRIRRRLLRAHDPPVRPPLARV